MRNLGELCGLMPQGIPTSEQLHIVVSLSAGMGDNPGPLNHPSPTDKLKEALCSQKFFIKTYLVSVLFCVIIFLANSIEILETASIKLWQSCTVETFKKLIVFALFSLKRENSLAGNAALKLPTALINK